MKGHYREEGGIPTPTPTPTPTSYTLGGCSMVKGEESEGTLQRRRRRKKKRRKEKGERRRANLSRRLGKRKENSGKR